MNYILPIFSLFNSFKIFFEIFGTISIKKYGILMQNLSFLSYNPNLYLEHKKL